MPGKSISSSVFSRSLLVITAMTAASFALATTVSSENYRLMHAIGNSEKEAGRDLTKQECESRKAELKKVAEALGTYDEKTGKGSITCLPESVFN